MGRNTYFYSASSRSQISWWQKLRKHIYIVTRIFGPPKFTITIYGLLLIIFSILTDLYLFVHSIAIKDHIRFCLRLSLGMGISFITAVILHRLFDSDNERRTSIPSKKGLIFIGDRTDFLKRIENNSGWDLWLNQTPTEGEVIAIGSRNRIWIEESSGAIKKCIQRNVELKFYFVASKEEEAKKNLEDFIVLLKNKNINSSNIKLFYVFDEKLPKIDSCGYYWNGNSLIVKLYIPDVANYTSPLIEFKADFVNSRFKVGDFSDDVLLNGIDQTPINNFAKSMDFLLNKANKWTES